MRHGPCLGEIHCKNGIYLEKIRNFENKATDFNFFCSNLKLRNGATNKEGPEKYSPTPFGPCLKLENEKSMDQNLRSGWNDYFILKLVLNNGFEILKYPEIFSKL